jgi:hypothetical protein
MSKLELQVDGLTFYKREFLAFLAPIFDGGINFM